MQAQAPNTAIARTGGRMVTFDAATPEGRKATRDFVKGLGTGTVPFVQTGAEYRASIVRDLGEAFAAGFEKLYGPYEDRTLFVRPEVADALYRARELLSAKREAA